MNQTKEDLYKDFENKSLGFHEFSERINGRVGMVGFVFVFLVEVFTKESILSFLN